MTRENLYVLASRAREKTTLYVATHDAPYDEDDRTDQARTDPYAYAAREILLNIIATETAPMSATETITTAQHEAGGLATLVPRYQHAVRQQAEHRYSAAAVQALGVLDGSALVSDPAWDAVACRLHDAEADGWDPVWLLALAASQLELATADSIAEVMAWRIDAHLNDAQVAPRHDWPYETMSAARDHLAKVARATLGPRASERAQAELAWPALLSALHRAEGVGLHPAELLSRLRDGRELRTTHSISEALALRVHRHLATHQDAGTGHVQAEAPLPWMASQHPASGSPAISRYLTEAANLISSRVTAITSTAIRHRPPWMQALGQPPDNPERERAWLDHVAIVAAYREQFAVTTDHPAQPLGLYAEPGTPAHTAYWRAAESVMAARCLAGLGAPGSAASPDAQVHAQIASNVYCALPEAEHTAVGSEVAARQGTMWFGSRTAPDDDAPTRSVHAMTLADALTEHSHLVPVARPADMRSTSQEPPDAGRVPLRMVRVRALTQQRKPEAAPQSHERPVRPTPPIQQGHQPRL